MNEFEQSVRETPIDKVNWDQLSEEWCVDLSIEFIRQYSDYLNWTKLARYKKFSKDLIREFYDKIEWDELSYFGCNAFNEKFFEEFNNDVNWNFILTKQKDKITEKIIKRFENERKCKEIK